MKKSILAFFGVLTFYTCAILPGALAQDPEFSQFYAAPVYVNPAFVGTANSGGARIVLNYRNQWPTLPGTFVTFAGSYDQHFDALSGGIGVLLTSDKAGSGLLTTTTASGIYSYELKTGSDLTIRAGLQAQYVQKNIDFSKLTWGDMIDPRQGFVFPTNEPKPSGTKAFPNFSAGLLAYTKKFYVGFAAHNLTEPNQSFFNNPSLASRLPRRYTFHGGITIPLGNRVNGRETSLSPAILFMSQNSNTQINIGTYLTSGGLVAGLWFRQTSANSDATMLLVGYKKDNFKFGYSYDITVSSGKAAALSSHEISASFEFGKKFRRDYRMHPCPDF